MSGRHAGPGIPGLSDHEGDHHPRCQSFRVLYLQRNGMLTDDVCCCPWKVAPKPPRVVSARTGAEIIVRVPDLGVLARQTLTNLAGDALDSEREVIRFEYPHVSGATLIARLVVEPLAGPEHMPPPRRTCPYCNH